MDETLHEMRARWGDCGVILHLAETEWMLMQLFWAADVVLAKFELVVNGKVSWFNAVCGRRMLKVKADK